MREGVCLCGAIRYRVAGEPLMTGLCHCRTCRKAASAPVLPYSVFPTAAFAITQGTPVPFQSSPDVKRSFCGRCGSSLTYQNAKSSPTLDVMTCSLDDPDSVKPAVHVWASHKIGWDIIDDSLPVFVENRTETA